MFGLGDTFAHLLRALIHGVDGLIDSFLDSFDQRGYLVGGLRDAFRQTSHLVGHNCEASPLLASARRLDGRIQRQQVGLGRYVVDHGDNLAYLF
jgi:hypothetical protein